MFTKTIMSSSKQTERGGKHSNRGGNRGGKYQGRGGKRIMMEPKEQDQVSNWLIEHRDDLTVEICIEQWKTQQDMISLINELIDMTPSNPQFLNILRDLKPYFPGRVKHEGGYKYNPLHKINWLPETTDPKVIGELYQIIHDVGYDVFMKNRQNEDAFLSLFKKFNQNKEDPNYIFRYNQLAKFSEKEINKIVTSIFNKIENISPEMIEIFHVLLLQDYHTVLRRMADAMTLRKIPSQCNVFDTLFLKYIEGISKILSGATNNFADLQPVVFCDIKKTIPTFELFFKQNEIVLPDTTQLVKLLWDYAIEVAVQSTGEYKNLNYEALGIIIGGFAETNRLYDQYKEFVLHCLDQDPNGVLSNINSEIRLRMALRAVVQSKQTKEEVMKTMPKDILQALSIIPYPSTYYKVIIRELLGLSYPIHIAPTKSIMQKISYFGDLDRDNIDDTVEYAMEQITEQMTMHPSEKNTLVQNFITSFLENMMPKYSIDEMKKIGQHLVTIKNEIFREKEYIEKNVIIDLKPDIPYCDKVWKDLIKVLG